MKKLSIILMIATILISVVGCGKVKEQNVEGNLTDIMESLYAGIDPEKMPMVENITLTDDNVANYLGTTAVSYEEALVSEPLIGSIAHSVVLLRTKDNADIEKIKSTLRDNINPRKWICVWVEPEDVIIKNKGNLVIAIVVKEKTIRDAVSKNFDNL